ncbi:MULTISPECIES: hypothetical protein [Methylorubrum]|uniref:hypothetical protein n=1 Tax=Methylorubrum TaxID=2282523 RepID=UPI00209CD5AB|nr:MULTISPECIES: hypothetical protein [Methylorubrum]MCP1550660.1 hypothetical protein [Methylorubrum zatmanii]MCP1552727.1 hypothetical protein [Methylorubrum extorquens]MCP1580963.1 hypothetical protein [Methylorubrum extorquens]
MILKRTKNKLQVGNLIVTASRWPWQGYGWRSTGGPTAPLNTFGARFGGGWQYKLGIQIGGTTVLLDLLFGILTFRWESTAARAAQSRREAEHAEWLRRFDAERAKHEAEIAAIRAGRRRVSDDIPF